MNRSDFDHVSRTLGQQFRRYKHARHELAASAVRSSAHELAMSYSDNPGFDYERFMRPFRFSNREGVRLTDESRGITYFVLLRGGDVTLAGTLRKDDGTKGFMHHTFPHDNAKAAETFYRNFVDDFLGNRASTRHPSHPCMRLAYRATLG